MIELGELEKRHQDFDGRKVRIVAVSNDKMADAHSTQRKFPHLAIASDPEQKMARAFDLIHEKMAADGTDTNAPTTFLIDGAGKVRWLFRPDAFVVRLTPDELLAAIDGALSAK